MAQAVAAWVAAKVTAIVISVTGTTSLTVAQAVYAVAYYGTQVAVTVGVSAAAQALSSGAPDPEAAKASLKQPIPPRIRGYGRRRLGISFMLWEAKNNYAYDVGAGHSGRIEAVEQIWLHDNIAEFVGGGVGGWVKGSPDYGGGNNDLIHIEYRLGLETETAYSAIVAALGGDGIWTESHRLDGIASLGADYRHAKKENLLKDFPNGALSLGFTGRLSPVWDFRDPLQQPGDPNAPYDPAWGWTASGNLALQIMDFCRRADGMAMDYDTELAPALEHWRGEADICDEAVPKKDGTTEPRYWGSGYYAMPGDPQDTQDKMLAACDGKLLRDEFGVARLWVGKVRAPTVRLTDEDIADYNVQGDAAAYDAVNELVSTFVSEAHKWTMVEATPWSNADDIALRGRVMSRPFPLEWVNSAALARRLAKRELSRQLTKLRGTLTGKLSAARAMGHRWIAVDLPDLDLINVTVECESGGRTSFARSAVDLPFSLVDPTIDEWDPETEEDGSGVAPDRPPTEDLEAPTLSSVTPFNDAIGDATGVRLGLLGEGPDRDDLSWLAGWRVTGDASWSESTYTDTASGPPVFLQTSFVPAVPSLDVRIAYLTGGGLLSPWSDEMSVDTSVPVEALAELDFVNNTYRDGTATAVTPSGLTAWAFSRSTAAYAQDAAGVLTSFAAGAPRLNGRGLLVEGAKTNLCLRSQELNDATAWGYTSASVTPNAAVAPDGTMTADTLLDNGANGPHRAFQTMTVVNGATYTTSVYVKPAGRTRVELMETDLGGALFDLTGSGSVVSGTGVIEALANGWYRIAITRTMTDTGWTTQLRLVLGTAFSYVGSGVGVHVWGNQTEEGALSSYIPTAGTAATRAADVATFALATGATADPLTVVWEGGSDTLTRADLANPNVFNFVTDDEGWVGRYVQTLTVNVA